MEFRILGPIEVADGDRVVPLPRLKHRALVALLVLHAGKIVSADRLVEDLWGGQPPPAARNALHNYIAQLRKSIFGERLVTRPLGYLLDVEPEQIDLARFDLGVTRARIAGNEAERASLLRDSLALWRGEPFADLADEPFTLVERPGLLDRRLSAHKDLIDAELALGHHAHVLGDIEVLMEEHRYDERLRRQLMLALYRAERPADALDAFARARRALDELGLEPGPELQALQRAILNHDPELLFHSATIIEEPIRKTITVFFAGLAELTKPGEGLDPERLRLLGDRVLAETQAAAARHGGTAERLPDGSAMAVFGVPVAHEDDTLRAVRAAEGVRESLRDHALAPRLGVSTGEVIVAGSGGVGAMVTGTPVSTARWLEQTASPGEILLGAPTLRLLRGAVTAEPIEPAGDPPVFRLLTLIEGAFAIERHLDAPLVGRTTELAVLREVFEETPAERRCRTVTVLGEAGIGKTRLVTEFGRGIQGRATVLTGRCVSYGQGASYLPLREILEQTGDDLDAMLADAGSVGEEHLILRGYLDSLAAAQPVLLVLEDIHWAEPTLLDLIESFAQHAFEAPILVVCLARPELLESRPAWPVELRLAPLEHRQTVALLDQIPAPVAPDIRARIAELSEGNPLYAEQLLAYVGEGGSLESVPPTVEALLAGRLDRLQPGVRAVLQRAAVTGREFDGNTVANLATPTSASTVDGHLADLAGLGLVRRTSREAWSFQHVLIRDVAYASLPKTQRGELHEQLADMLDRAAADELVGYHLEQAFRYASEVGAADGRTRRLAVDAGGRLGAAGVRAWKRGDTPATVNLLRRATDLLPEHDPFRLELRCELGIALRGAGELREAEDVLADAAATSAVAHDRRAGLRARLELANVRLLSDPGSRAGEVLAAAVDGIPVFEAVEDDRSLSRAWRLTAYVEGAMSCRYAASAQAAERALDHCERSGWSTAACLGDLAAALHYGPTPVAAGVRRCRRLLEGADLGGEANVLVHLGSLEAMRGRVDEARRLIGRSRSLYEDLGQHALAHVNCPGLLGEIELLIGDPVAAERAFRASCEALESIGDRAYLATRAAQLAEALYLTGRGDEAAQWSGLAEESAARDDIPTQFLWRSIRAKLLASDGKADEAVALAQEAVRLAELTDALNQHAKVVLNLAEVLRLCGRRGDSTAIAEQALALFEQKGNTVAASRVHLLLAQ